MCAHKQSHKLGEISQIVPTEVKTGSTEMKQCIAK